MKKPIINLFGPAKSDISKSMKIYTDQIFSGLKRQSNNDYNIKMIELKDKNLPLVKNIFSKDLYYPVLARIMSADINHITDHSHGLLALFLNPKTTVVTCHDLNAIVYEKQSSLLGKIRFWFNVLAMKRARNIVTISESTRKTILKYLNYKGQITVTYLAADPVFCLIPSTKRVEVRRKLGFKPGDKIMLHVGHSNPVKNVELILRILLKLKKYKFIKVGNFNKNNLEYIERNKLGKRIINLKNLEIEKLKELYNIADIFIFPSFVEGFGMPVLEAMACGCPVLCSNASSLPEVGGNAALYFDPNDDAKAIEIIREIDADKQLRKNTIVKGLTQAKKFSWDKNAMELNELYKKIISEE